MAAFRRGFRLSGQVLRASTWKRQCVAPRSIGGRLLHRDCAASHASVALRAFSSSVHTQDPSKSAATRTPLPNVGRRGHELSQTLKSATSWRDAIVAFRRACGRDADTAQSMGLADVTGLRFREANVRNLCTCFYRVCHLLPNRGQDHLAQDSDLLWLLDEGFTRLRTAIDTAAHGSKLDISGTPIAMLMRDLAWSRLAMASPQGKHLFSALVVAAETRLNGMSLRELADVATALSVRRNAAPALTSAITQAALEGMEDTDMRTAARLLRALASVHDQAALKPLAEACTDVVLGALESAPPTVLAPHLPAIVSAFASIRPSSTSEVLNLALQRASRDVLPLMPKSKAIHLAFMLRPEVGVSALQSPLLAHATHHGTADLTDADLVSLCSVFHPKNVSNTRAFLEATFEEVVLRASAQKAGSFRMVLQWLALVRTARLVDDMQRQVSMVLRRLKFPRTRVSAKQLESLMSAVAMVPGNHSALLQGLGDQVMRRCSRDASGSGSMEQPIPADMAKVVVRAVWTMVHGCDGARSVPLDLLSHDLVELALTSMASDTPAMDVGVGSLGLLAQVFNTVELQVNNAGDDESSGVPPAILGLVDPPHPRFSALRACIRRRDYFAREVAETLSPSRDVVNIDVYTDLGYRVHALFPGSSHALHFVSDNSFTELFQAVRLAHMLAPQDLSVACVSWRDFVGASQTFGQAAVLEALRAHVETGTGAVLETEGQDPLDASQLVLDAQSVLDRRVHHSPAAKS